MSEYHVPKGVSLSTLEDIVVGWATAGAAVEPTYTSAVAEATGIEDAVGRQTRFLEAVDVLEQCGQQHRLTGAGQALAGALMADAPDVVAERTRVVLDGWGLTDDIRGILRANTMSEDELVPVVASLAGRDLDDSRIRTGITTLLALFERGDIVDRDEAGRYRLTDRADATVDGPTAGADQNQASDSRETGGTDEMADHEAGTDEANGEGDDADGSAPGSDRDSVGGPAIHVGETATDERPAVACPACGFESADSRALSLELDVGADAANLESLVAALRRGLVESGDL